MSFCTVINCMDGRVQLPVIRYLQQRFGVEYVDSITEPGPNGILAGAPDGAGVTSILARVDISVFRHGSTGLAVVGHHDCAGNPAPPERQVAQTRAAVQAIRSRYADLPVIGLWVDGHWTVQELVQELVK